MPAARSTPRSRSSTCSTCSACPVHAVALGTIEGGPVGVLASCAARRDRDARAPAAARAGRRGRGDRERSRARARGAGPRSGPASSGSSRAARAGRSTRSTAEWRARRVPRGARRGRARLRRRRPRPSRATGARPHLDGASTPPPAQGGSRARGCYVIARDGSRRVLVAVHAALPRGRCLVGRRALHRRDGGRRRPAAAASQGTLSLLDVVVVTTVAGEVGGLVGYAIGSPVGALELLGRPGRHLATRLRVLAEGRARLRAVGAARRLLHAGDRLGDGEDGARPVRRSGTSSRRSAFAVSVCASAYGLGRLLTGHLEVHDVGTLLVGLLVGVALAWVVRRHRRRTRESRGRPCPNRQVDPRRRGVGDS